MMSNPVTKMVKAAIGAQIITDPPVHESYYANRLIQIVATVNAAQAITAGVRTCALLSRTLERSTPQARYR
jgi:hypothetical protein